MYVLWMCTKCRFQSGILIGIFETVQVNALLHSLTHVLTHSFAHSLTLMRLSGHLLRVFQVENCVILGAIKSLPPTPQKVRAGTKAKAKSEQRVKRIA